MTQRENAIKPISPSGQAADESLYDLSILEEMDDKEYIVEIVSMFLRDTPGELKEIKAALTAGNTEVVYKKAHKLKSSAGILQAQHLINLLTDLERIAKTEKIDADLSILLENVQRQYKDLEQALQQLLKKMAA